MAINADILKKRTFDFALTTFRVVDKLQKSTTNEVMGKQLIRCCSSVGANYRAACKAKSSPDFEKILIESRELERIFAASAIIAKKNLNIKK